MTEPLNYTTKAIAGLMDFANLPTISDDDRKGIHYLVNLLRRAEVFALPDRGELIDRGRPRPEVPPTVFRPPYPVVALEYSGAGKEWGDPIYSAITSSRRISLAWEFDGTLPAIQGSSSPHDPVPGEGVVIASICYIDGIRQWVPIPVAAMIPFDGMYIHKQQGDPLLAAMQRQGRVTSAQASAKTIEIRGLMTLLPSALTMSVAQHGQTGMMNMMRSDLMDEVNAYCDLAIALSCNNVSTELRRQPDKLNRARIKAGKVPLKDFHVLKIAGAGEGESFGGAGHGGVRSHLRRGHIRRLGPDRITWVNACMVRGSRPGFADKAYELRGQA